MWEVRGSVLREVRGGVMGEVRGGPMGEGRGGPTGEVRSEPRCQRWGSVPCRMSGENIPGRGKGQGKGPAAGLVYSRSIKEARVAGPEGKGERQRRGGRRWGSGPEEHQND